MLFCSHFRPVLCLDTDSEEGEGNDLIFIKEEPATPAGAISQQDTENMGKCFMAE